MCDIVDPYGCLFTHLADMEEAYQDHHTELIQSHVFGHWLIWVQHFLDSIFVLTHSEIKLGLLLWCTSMFLIASVTFIFQMNGLQLLVKQATPILPLAVIWGSTSISISTALSSEISKIYYFGWWNQWVYVWAPPRLGLTQNSPGWMISSKNEQLHASLTYLQKHPLTNRKIWLCIHLENTRR